MKKLSIIIPSYNVEEYIEECLMSLLPQLTDEIQLIVVDDGSTDGTKEIIKNLRIEYDFMFLNYAANRGPGAARNNGLKFARGEYVVFIDSDDYVAKNYISKILEALKHNRDYYKFGWAEFGVRGNIRHPIKGRGLANNIVSTSILRRSLIKHLFDETLKYGEDTLFWQQNFSTGYTDYAILDILYYYRRGREGSLCDLKKKELL